MTEHLDHSYLGDEKSKWRLDCALGKEVAVTHISQNRMLGYSCLDRVLFFFF